jgi:hypothetical protein
MTTIRILASATPRDGCLSLANVLASNSVPLVEAIALYRKVASGEETEVVIQNDWVAAMFRRQLEELNCEYLTLFESQPELKDGTAE